MSDLMMEWKMPISWLDAWTRVDFVLVNVRVEVDYCTVDRDVVHLFSGAGANV